MKDDRFEKILKEMEFFRKNSEDSAKSRALESITAGNAGDKDKYKTEALSAYQEERIWCRAIHMVKKNSTIT